ncbi:ribonuclease HII [Candidatus Gracilibacteria bacterium]|nr:ribonuclease HII [Candidatus Gracilibacteria bacterium]
MKKTKIKIGIDEAGRGPWCGPVVACALAWNSNNKPSKDFISMVNDSKKLTAKKRDELYTKIIKLSREKKLYFGVGVVDNYVIDEINIRQANREAMRRAIVEIKRKIPEEFSEISVVIDGRDNYEFDELEQKPLYIVGGDGKVPEIGAASIIAKVFRDKLMTQYATLYPDLGLETNAGYGTKKHREALIEKSDITGIHRTSYKPIKTVLEKKEKVLVHICCGPDATVPLMDLKEEYDVIAYWYDPNIQPVAEHEKRYEAFVQVCEIEGVDYIRGEYDVKNFFTKIKGLEDTPERGEKCTECYDMRLERTARLAREMGISKWTSSLNNSPHKDMEKMFDLGEKWDKRTTAQQYLTDDERNQASKLLGITIDELISNGDISETEIKKEATKKNLEFLKIAFRKNGGFQRSVDYTNEHEIYRQNYCGCVYSDTFPGREKKGAKGGFSG